ncbi:hypothetical protein PMAYCL1PPCAC_20231, partial [Pristionchus mayeri]
LSVLTGIVFNYTFFFGATLAALLCYIVYRSSQRMWNSNVQNINEMVNLGWVSFYLYCASLCSALLSNAFITIIITFILAAIPHVSLVIKILKERTLPDDEPHDCLLMLSSSFIMFSLLAPIMICEPYR